MGQADLLISIPFMTTITAIFPICQVPDIDWEGIKQVQALEDRLNAQEQNTHAQRLASAVQSGNTDSVKQVLLENPHKHIYNAWKYR